MAMKYRRIDPRVWKDEKFVALSGEEKLVAIYCITAQSNRIGLFNFSPGMAAEDLGILPETFRERFLNVCQTLFWGWDSTLRVLHLPTWWKYNPPENGNVLKGCLNDLADIPQTPLLQAFYDRTRNVAETFGVTLPQTLPKPSPIQEQELKTQELIPPNPPEGGNGSGTTESQNPNRKPRAARAKSNPEADPLFVKFWSAYPRREKKPDAARAFAAHKPDEALLALLLAAIDRQRRPGGCLEARATADGRSTIPHPSSWLNQRRWEETPPETNPAPVTLPLRRPADRTLLDPPLAPPMTSCRAGRTAAQPAGEVTHAGG